MIEMSLSDILCLSYLMDARDFIHHTQQVCEHLCTIRITSLRDELSLRIGNLGLKPEAIEKSASGTKSAGQNRKRLQGNAS